MAWFVRVGEQVLGPYPFEELEQAARAGKIQEHTIVRNGSVGAWALASTVPGLIAKNSPSPTEEPPTPARPTTESYGMSKRIWLLPVLAVLGGAAFVYLYERHQFNQNVVQANDAVGVVVAKANAWLNDGSFETADSLVSEIQTDATNLIERKRDRQHSGLLTETGASYPNLERVIKSCTNELYAIATS